MFPAHLPDDHPYKPFKGKQKSMRAILEKRGYIRPGQKKIIGDCAAYKAWKKRKPQVVGNPNPDLHPKDLEELEEEDNDDIPIDCCMQHILSLQEDFQSQKSLLEIVSGSCHTLSKP